MIVHFRRGAGRSRRAFQESKGFLVHASLKAHGAQQMVGLRVLWVAAKHDPATRFRLLEAAEPEMLNGLRQRIRWHRSWFFSVTLESALPARRREQIKISPIGCTTLCSAACGPIFSDSLFVAPP